jgi:hypothetical protein
MRHSIFSVIIAGIVIGAALFFMPLLVLGIIFIVFIIRLLHFGCMGHGYYGHGYRRGYDCGPGYGRGYGRGYDSGYGHCCEDDGYHEHFHGHGPMHGHMFHWADKIRNMSEEEFAEFKNKMGKGFGYGFRDRNYGDNGKCNCEGKSDAERNTEPTEKKEETTK